eukprot:GDKJ01016643.1.p1 GENE.GDKJ01016643.1~~GDKJ01016643.1.p1  ORF type:complete len:1035 (+),score=273.73 GDKJ01016643.1:57-3107(+)
MNSRVWSANRPPALSSPRSPSSTSTTHQANVQSQSQQHPLPAPYFSAHPQQQAQDHNPSKTTVNTTTNNNSNSSRPPTPPLSARIQPHPKIVALSTTNSTIAPSITPNISLPSNTGSNTNNNTNNSNGNNNSFPNTTGHGHQPLPTATNSASNSITPATVSGGRVRRNFVATTTTQAASSHSMLFSNPAIVQSASNSSTTAISPVNAYNTPIPCGSAIRPPITTTTASTNSNITTNVPTNSSQKTVLLPQASVSSSSVHNIAPANIGTGKHRFLSSPLPFDEPNARHTSSSNMQSQPPSQTQYHSSRSVIQPHISSQFNSNAQEIHAHSLQSHSNVLPISSSLSPISSQLPGNISQISQNPNFSNQVHPNAFHHSSQHNGRVPSHLVNHFEEEEDLDSSFCRPATLDIIRVSPPNPILPPQYTPCLPHSWRRGPLLGQGSLGHVFSGIDLRTGEQFAVKEAPIGHLVRGGEKIRETVREIVQYGYSEDDACVVGNLGRRNSDISVGRTVNSAGNPSVSELNVCGGCQDASCACAHTASHMSSLLLLENLAAMKELVVASIRMNVLSEDKLGMLILLLNTHEHLHHQSGNGSSKIPHGGLYHLTRNQDILQYIALSNDNSINADGGNNTSFSNVSVGGLSSITNEQSINHNHNDFSSTPHHENNTSLLSANGTSAAIGDQPANPALSNHSAALEQLINEILFYNSIRHPNILSYKGFDILSSERLFVYLEVMGGGSVASFTQEYGAMPESLVRKYMAHIVLAVECLHSNGIVHRDIKGANVLISDDGSTAKLSDFGCSKRIIHARRGSRSSGTSSYSYPNILNHDDPDQMSDGVFVGSSSHAEQEPGSESNGNSNNINYKNSLTYTLKGSVLWMPPEVITSSGHGRKVDIWAIGCLAVEMAVGRPPWSERNFDNLFHAMLFIMSATEGPSCPEKNLSPVGRHFLATCCKRSPEERPTARALLSHPFIRKDVLNCLETKKVVGLSEKFEYDECMGGLKELKELIAEVREGGSWSDVLL